MPPGVNGHYRTHHLRTLSSEVNVIGAISADDRVNGGPSLAIFRSIDECYNPKGVETPFYVGTHPMEMIDLRSDTVTRPDSGMRKAMAEADVGDDVFGEDPTVNALEAETAHLFGKEAALFVASGTMANQVSLRAHTQPGDEVVAHPNAHIVRAESGAGAALSGVQFRMVGNPGGGMDVDALEAVLQSGDDHHFAPTRLICMENTHNFAGGRVLPMEMMEAISNLAKGAKIATHLDGARVMNACVKQDIQPAKVAALFDSITLCFSKGLGAPVGSIVAGERDFIRQCRRYRKMFGGGMRQAGILAAAARFALKHNVSRLAEDHANAQRLAQALAEHPYLRLPYGMPDTNLVFFQCVHPEITMDDLLAALKAKGVLLTNMGAGLARAVTHLDISPEGVEQSLKAVNEALPA